MITRRATLLGALATVSLPGGVRALPFDGGWTHQTFPRRTGNRYQQGGDFVDVSSEGGVSLLIREVPQAQWGVRRASWRWQVSASVPPTDLAKKGGDDRNLAIYFVFLPMGLAERLQGASPRRVLTHRAARSLVYVWGGNGGRGQVLQSPWMGAQGRTLPLRLAGTGAHAEKVDLQADFRRAFGADPEALFGIGISADSDDSATQIKARIENLQLG